MSNSLKFSINITLLNVATKDRDDLCDKLEDHHYKRHKNELSLYCDEYNDETCILFNPYSYYIFGTYDIAILSLINNYTFSQKLLFPKVEGNDADNNVPNYTYQIITGILNDDEPYSLDAFYDSFSFLTVLNLKINNKFILKDGIVFLEKTIKTIHEILRSARNTYVGNDGSKTFQYTVLQSFSWFEISILFFSNDPQTIAKIIHKIRSIKVHETGVSTFVYRDSVLHDYNNSDVFMDSQSYFGLKRKMSDEEKKKVRDVTLLTQVEWQVKPGHYDRFLGNLASFNAVNFTENFDMANPKMVFGKSDYVLDEVNPQKFSNNIDILDYFQSEKKGLIFENIKNIYTRVFFSIDLVEQHEIANSSQMNAHDLEVELRPKFHEYINISNVNISVLDKLLKALKISRQTREMTLKLLHIYVNGIQDDVLSIYFLDFYHYVEDLVYVIEDYHGKYRKVLEGDVSLINLANDFGDIVEFEDKLYDIISRMDEGIKLRMLNSYRFEDITDDLALGFNSNTQQLLSMYNSLANQYGSMIYSPEQTPYIVLLNYRSTVSNINVINYNVYDLLHPEFIFVSLSKEILNSVGIYLSGQKESDGSEGAETTSDIGLQLKNIKMKLWANLNDNGQPFFPELDELLRSEVIDIDYLFNDALRFVIAANFDAEMFVYWTWAVTLKNSSAYDVSGTLKVDEFKCVLFRLMFTLRLYNYKAGEILYCPIPQLESSWANLYHVIENEIDNVFNDCYSMFQDIVKPLKRMAVKILHDVYENIYDGPDKVIDESPISSRLSHCEVNLLEVDPQCIYLRYRHLNTIAAGALLEGYSTFKQPDDNREKVFLCREIEEMMYEYLTWIKHKNFGTSDYMLRVYAGETHSGQYIQNMYINYLHRNQLDGKPLRVTNDFTNPNPSTTFYKIDQTGAVFFVSLTKANEYFTARNNMLKRIWHISTKFKANITTLNSAR